MRYQEEINSMEYENHVNHEQMTQLFKVVKDEHDLKEMTDSEIYAHINALKYHIRFIRSSQSKGCKVAIDVLKKWQQLEENMKNNPEVKNLWDQLIVYLKLKNG